MNGPWLEIALAGCTGLVLGLHIATKATGKDVDRWIAAYLIKWDELNKANNIIHHIKSRLHNLTNQ